MEKVEFFDLALPRLWEFLSGICFDEAFDAYVSRNGIDLSIMGRK
jgi:hypothetical protein